MKNSFFTYLIGGCLIALFTTSCINEDYNLDNIDKQGVFSPEGISIPVGNLNKIELDFEFEGILDEAGYEKDFEDFFTESLFDRFIIKKDGKEEGIGNIEFSADFRAYIKNEKSEITVSVIAQALDERGQKIVEMFNDEMYANNNEDELEDQPFILKVAKEDMIKMRRAKILRFSFKVNTREFDVSNEDDNYVEIKNMLIKSTGGIAFDLDSND